MVYRIMVSALLLAGCGEAPPTTYCPGYSTVSFICSEVCNRLWAKSNGTRLYLFTSESDCDSNSNPIFIGEESNELY